VAKIQLIIISLALGIFSL